MRVRQVINALDRADAVSSCLLETDRMLRALGHETEIYYESAHRSLASRGRPVTRLAPDGADLVLFHYAGHSRILARVARSRGRRGLVFHNVTPAHHFEGMPETWEFCRRAEDQLPELPELFDFGVGVSAFNARALETLGFRHTRVLPIAWETSGFADAEPDAATLARFGDGVTNVLVVGRVAPHKGAHRAVEALPEIERRLGRQVRLLVAGRTSGYGPYVERVRAAIRDARADDRVVLTGEVSPEELLALYRSASVLLLLSEHEGFCVPLVEAMALDVPIVAAPAGAVEETLGGAGVLLADRSPPEIARGVERALAERASVLEGQRRRRDAFSRPAVTEALRELLAWAAVVPRREPARRLPSCSVVVCTYQREAALARCLASLRRQDWPELEVVVVEGPSTDGTAALLDGVPDVKRVTNRERNLSISRNLGIAASAGEIVAFLDDDAEAEPGWLRALAAAFDDPTVGAAGGDVFGPRGDHLQFSGGIVARSGRVIAQREAPDERNDAAGPWWNTLMGTNAAFRRRALDAVGGFDENYEYYHDEADLCVRVIQAGYRVAHVPEAVVWHGFAPGAARRSDVDFDFTVIEKNSIYFAFCVQPWRRRPWRLLEALGGPSRDAARVVRWLLGRRLGPVRAARLLAGWARGVAQGYRKGFVVPPRRDLARRAGSEAPPFLPYASAERPRGRPRLHVALVSQQYPPDACGGIGVYTEQLARGLVREGHRVSVIASGPRAAIDEAEGVEVYRLPRTEAPAGIPLGMRVTRKNVARSLAVHRIVDALARTAGLSVVESPLWDAEAYATSLEPPVPLVVRLNTPMALAVETQGWEWSADYRLAAGLEWSLLENAHAVIDPSGTIVETIAERFGVRPRTDRVLAIPFGTALPDAPVLAGRDDVRFLFVGRLEPRKGIDTLLAAVPRVLEACPEASFDVAGEAPPGVAPASLAVALSSAHRARVRFHGLVDDETRARLFDACEAFVAPSRYESFGIVYLEAMAHARACVACDAGGPAQIVVPGETGILVPPGDADALADALIDLARRPERRRRLGDAGRRRVEARFGLDAMVRRTIELYEEATLAWRGRAG